MISTVGGSGSAFSVSLLLKASLLADNMVGSLRKLGDGGDSLERISRFEEASRRLRVTKFPSGPTKHFDSS